MVLDPDSGLAYYAGFFRSECGQWSVPKIHVRNQSTHMINRTHEIPESNQPESTFRPDPGPFYRRFLQCLHHAPVSRVYGQTEPDPGPGGTHRRRQPVPFFHRPAGSRLPGGPLPGSRHHSRRPAHGGGLHSPFRHRQQLRDADAVHRPGVRGVLAVSPVRGRHDSALFRQSQRLLHVRVQHRRHLGLRRGPIFHHRHRSRLGPGGHAGHHGHRVGGDRLPVDRRTVPPK